MTRHPILSVLLTFLISAFWVALIAAEGRITRKDAKRLVLAELKAEGYDIDSPKFELNNNTDPSFAGVYAFDAYFDTPDRLAHIDAYAVDPSTGALWDLGLCTQPKTPTVRQLQEVLQHRYNLRTPTRESKPPCDIYAVPRTGKKS